MLTVSFKDGTRKNVEQENPWFDWNSYSEVVDLVLSGELLNKFKKTFPTFPWPDNKNDVVIVGEMAQYMFANYF